MILRINFRNREIKSYEITRVRTRPVGYYICSFVIIQFSTETRVDIRVAMVNDARFV
ncbi:hypothetical protein C0J52_19142 [Blattella germanica]|nr:hypothetical protein C0J52_19142 [Blattella germanica]